ncbi:calmodulin-4-like [Ylistrum balloti]|uniref:calmodulin-4-like n=1 Tax=Ylistrum balloti TaxID=509963 RepID=UPI002905D8A9|nr:calmodulin-4-like [Ylistrum balloti]
MAVSEEKFMELYKKADVKNNGFLTVVQLKDMIKKELCNTISDEDVTAIFCAIDKNGDNRITWEEFKTEMCKKDRRTAFSEQFKALDKEGCGKLPKGLICQMLKEENLDDDQIEAMFSRLDANDDGVISREEFMGMV